MQFWGHYLYHIYCDPYCSLSELTAVLGMNFSTGASSAGEARQWRGVSLMLHDCEVEALGLSQGVLADFILLWLIDQRRSWRQGVKLRIVLFVKGEVKTPGFTGGTSAPPASVGDTRNMGSICGSGRSPRGGNGNPLQFSCWRIPWTEEPVRLQSMGLQRVGHDWATEHTQEKSKNFEPLCEIFSWM